MIPKIIQRLRGMIGKRYGHTASDTPILIRAQLASNMSTGCPTMCNLGCGSRMHPDWINIDFQGDGKNVLSWDLRHGLPLPDHSCDAVYSSHAIEHFDRDGARRFLLECRRVLKPGGVIRLVAPDLESIVRAYLACLDAARRGEFGASDRYDWIIIELLDQMVRHRGGGEMLKYWCREEVPAEDFVASRVGTEYWRARKHCKGRALDTSLSSAGQVGNFRLGGEVHQWMYDRYSLGKLLADSGFTDICPCRADESSISDFTEYDLDTEPDGSVYKPDSFFIEAKTR